MVLGWGKLENIDCKLIINNIPDIMTILDKDGNAIFISPSVKDVLGFDVEDRINKNVFEFIHRNDVEKVKNAIENLRRTKGSGKVEYRYKNASSSFVWLETSGRILFDEKENEKGIICFTRDITEKKKYIEEQEKKHEMLKAIIESTKGGVLAYDNKGNILEMNTILKSMFKIDSILKEEIEIIPYVKSIIKDFNNFLKKSKILVKTKKVHAGKLESIDGKIFEYYTRQVYSGSKTYGRIWQIFDVTSDEKTKESLRRKEEQYRKFFELMPDPIIVHRNGEILYANNAAYKIVGTDKLIGKSVFEFLHIDFREIVNKRIKDTYENGTTLPWFEEKIIDKYGNIIDVEVAATPVEIDGDIVSLVVLRDLTQKKELEINKTMLNEQLEIERIRTEFFANISHELRTPLNVLLGSIQLLQLLINNEDIMVQEKLMKYIRIMKQNCYRLLRLVNNIIDITKIDAGYFEIHPQNVDIVKLVEDIVLSVSDYVEEQGLEIIFDTNVEEKIVGVDPDKIERIVLNLISNAIKFTDKGGKILIKVCDKDDSLKISVKDTGIGIPGDKLNLIFDRFRQVDKSLHRNREGSGIGLSLVKSLVEMHGREISVTSEVGEGSNFIVKLPKRIATDEYNDLSNKSIDHSYVERIKIEFSDIYS